MLARSVCVVLVGAALVMTSAEAQLVNTAWPMFHHDLRHTGKTTVAGPSSEPVNVRLLYKSGNWVKGQAALGPDGTLFFGAGFKPVCALNPATAKLKWCVGHVAANSASPAVGQPVDAIPNPPYRIYAGARDNKLWAVGSDGIVDWKDSMNNDGDVRSAPAIGPGGTIYTACGCTTVGLVVAVNPNGIEKWRVNVKSLIGASAPALVERAGVSRVYIGSRNGFLHAIDDLGTSGELRWSQDAGNKNMLSSPAVDANGIIYIGNQAGLAVVRDDGNDATGLGTYPTHGLVDTTAAIDDAHGMLYVSSYASASGTRTLYAINLATSAQTVLASGPGSTADRWSQTPSPVIDKDGIVYAAIGELVYAFKPDGTQQWSGPVTLPADVIALSIGNGVLYASAKNSSLYAIGP